MAEFQYNGYALVIGIFLFIFLLGIRIVRPTNQALVKRLGKYHHFAGPGFHWIIPVIDHLYRANITEQMVDASPQEIITNDNLNAMVDAQILKKLETVQSSLENNSKIIVPANQELVNVIGEMAGIVPLKKV